MGSGESARSLNRAPGYESQSGSRAENLFPLFLDPLRCDGEAFAPGGPIR
jgi:hypothetical protein